MKHILDKINESATSDGSFLVHTYQETQTFGRFSTLESAEKIQMAAVTEMRKRLPPSQWENVFVTDLRTMEIEHWVNPNDPQR